MELCICPVSLVNSDDEAMPVRRSNCWTTCQPASFKMLVVSQGPVSLAKSLHIFIHEISLSFIVDFIHQWVHSLIYIPRFLTFVKSTSCQSPFHVCTSSCMSNIRESLKHRKANAARTNTNLNSNSM